MPHDVPNAIVRAAEVRAYAGSWAAAAEAAGWTVRGLQRWIRSHPALWAREVGRARREARDEAGDESVVALRKKLRDKESKTVLDAAKIVGQHFAAKKKPRPAPPPDLPSQFLDLVTAIPSEQSTRVDRHIQASEDEGRAAPR
jgi:hypothetical protein